VIHVYRHTFKAGPLLVVLESGERWWVSFREDPPIAHRSFLNWADDPGREWAECDPDRADQAVAAVRAAQQGERRLAEEMVRERRRRRK
jgi:hypothetical protein